MSNTVNRLDPRWLENGGTKIDTIIADPVATTTQVAYANNSGTATYTPSTTILTNGYWYAGWVGRIRLTLSDVMRLKAVAKKDKKVRDILRKFTDHIELVVDFEEV